MEILKKRMSKAFGKNVYLLGEDKEGAKYWLEEASWDCGWYWGFGYVEAYTNNNEPNMARDITRHQRFDSMFLKKEIFSSYESFFAKSTLKEKEIWQLLELMQTFYTLKETASLLQFGGSHVTSNPLENLLKSEEQGKEINEKILPTLFAEVYKLLTPDN